MTGTYYKCLYIYDELEGKYNVITHTPPRQVTFEMYLGCYSKELCAQSHYTGSALFSYSDL